MAAEVTVEPVWPFYVDPLAVVTPGSRPWESLPPPGDPSDQHWVLYHKGCFDGVAALWAVQQWAPTALCLGVTPGRPVDLSVIGDNSHVHIVDCSLPREDLIALQARVRSVVLLDHHATAAEKLADLSCTLFHDGHSGCALAYHRYVRCMPPRPAVDAVRLRAEQVLLAYIQDRDLWQHKLPHSREVNACLRSFPADTTTINVFLADMTDGYHKYGRPPVEWMVRDGEGVLRVTNSLVGRMVAQTLMLPLPCDVRLDGIITVPTVNASCLVSEIGEVLLNNYGSDPFVVVWYEGTDLSGKRVRTYNLRSRGDFDVSAVAKRFGGGGHKQAAGFTLVHASGDHFVIP